MEWLKGVTGLSVLVGILIAERVIGMVIKITAKDKAISRQEFLMLKDRVNDHKKKIEMHLTTAANENLKLEQRLGQIQTQQGIMMTKLTNIEQTLRNGRA